MSDLKFNSTLSLADFKTQQGVSSIDVITNPATKKDFFTTGSTSGAIASKIDYKLPLSVSSVDGEDSEGNVITFFLLHNKATTNVKMTL